MNDEQLDSYSCANCGGEFLKEWTDDEAQAEYVANFPIGSTVPDDAVLVCDDCYIAMTAWKTPAQYEAEVYGNG